MDQEHHPEEKPALFASRAKLVLIGFMAVAAYFLVTEHGAHIVPYLPWLLLLACPLMHVFMHHGHHGHGSESEHSASSDNRPNEPHQH